MKKTTISLKQRSLAQAEFASTISEAIKKALGNGVYIEYVVGNLVINLEQLKNKTLNIIKNKKQGAK